MTNFFRWTVDLLVRNIFMRLWFKIKPYLPTGDFIIQADSNGKLNARFRDIWSNVHILMNNWTNWRRFRSVRWRYCRRSIWEEVELQNQFPDNSGITHHSQCVHDRSDILSRALLTWLVGQFPSLNSSSLDHGSNTKSVFLNPVFRI